MSRRDRLEEKLVAAQARLLREHLADLRAEQRDELPPSPTGHDRALAATSTPAQRARLDALLVEAGFTHGDLARADALLAPPANDAPVDMVTRARARALRRRHG